VSVDGAVAATGIDTDTAWHYGDPLREQRRLAQEAGVIDRSNRGVIAIPGVDRLSWLHSICTQHLEKLADGASLPSLVLSPNGHVEQQWQVTELGDTTWLDVEPGTVDEVLGYLKKMQFMKRVDPTDVSSDWAVLSVAGPTASVVLTAAGYPTPEPGFALALDGGGFARALPWSSTWVDLVIPRASKDDVFAALISAGAAPAGSWAAEALRVEARQPRLHLETDHRTIPHEVGWIGTAVHMNKGCYRGQETVARVANLGRPPRRLVLLHLSGDSDELPPAGTPVELDGRTIGFLGTAVQHYELGPIALAVIKRSIPDDAVLVVAGSPVSVG
jgi:folate-binding protein YgfZ